jgi:alkylation response protein AidB-like acyl-CoA dehydrogenase
LDFEDSPDDAAFRAQARDWLAARAQLRTSNAPRPRIEKGDTSALDAARAWQATKAEAGYACVTWAPEHGGRNGSAVQDMIFRAEEAAYDLPDNPFLIGLGMCIPTLLHHGSAEAIDRFAPPAVRGDEIWCQLFSEPSGGSDLASLRTRAQREGDSWRISGQKIWTSRAHLADFGLLLARTDPDLSKHAGLTMFWVDMRAPGVTVQPIRQMSGESEFNEVFLVDVILHDSQRVGAVNGGWKVAMSTLSQERLAVGIGEEAGNVDDFITHARAAGNGMIGEAMKLKIADWFVAEQGLRLTVNRTLTTVQRGGKPGPEASIVKLVAASQRQDIAGQALDLLGEAGLAAGPGSGGQDFQHLYLWSPAARIAGGTDEILRNIIAERVLGLPAEIHADKGLPFNKIPVGR